MIAVNRDYMLEIGLLSPAPRATSQTFFDISAENDAPIRVAQNPVAALSLK